MKPGSKTLIAVKLITVIVVLIMLVPGLSLFIKDGGLGMNMEIGSESVFEVSEDTTALSIETNLNSSYSSDARYIMYDGVRKNLSEDNSTLADTIKTYVGTKGTPVTVTAYDNSDMPVKIPYIDTSTEDEFRMAVTIETSPLAARTVIPDLRLSFDMGDFSAETDSSMSISEGTIRLDITLPNSTFVFAQVMGCNMVLDLGIEYVKIANVNVKIDIGNVSGVESDITISGGVETLSVDMKDASDADYIMSLLEGLPTTGAEINGIPLTVNVDTSAKTATISADVGTKTLSQMLEESLDANDGCIVITTGDPDDILKVPADQAEDIIAMIEYMEGSA